MKKYLILLGCAAVASIIIFQVIPDSEKSVAEPPSQVQSDTVKTGEPDVMAFTDRSLPEFSDVCKKTPAAPDDIFSVHCKYFIQVFAAKKFPIEIVATSSKIMFALDDFSYLQPNLASAVKKWSAQYPIVLVGSNFADNCLNYDEDAGRSCEVRNVIRLFIGPLTLADAQHLLPTIKKTVPDAFINQPRNIKRQNPVDGGPIASIDDVHTALLAVQSDGKRFASATGLFGWAIYNQVYTNQDGTRVVINPVLGFEGENSGRGLILVDQKKKTVAYVENPVRGGLFLDDQTLLVSEPQRYSTPSPSEVIMNKADGKVPPEGLVSHPGACCKETSGGEVGILTKVDLRTGIMTSLHQYAGLGGIFQTADGTIYINRLINDDQRPSYDIFDSKTGTMKFVGLQSIPNSFVQGPTAKHAVLIETVKGSGDFYIVY